MKSVKRIGSSLTVVCGLLALSLLAPGCGDDDEAGDDVVGGTGGLAGGGGARAGSGGTRAGAGGSAGRAGSPGAGGTAGTVSAVGGQGGAGEGGVWTGGTGGTPEGGTGGDPQGGNGPSPEGGTGGTPEGGTGGAPEGGTSGEGGSGGSAPALECLDGCLSLLVPLTGTTAQAQYFALQFAEGQDLSEAVVTFRVRVKGTYEGDGYIRGYANTPDFNSLTAGMRTNLAALTGWTDITFDFNDRPATLAEDVGQIGLEIGRDAGGTVSDVHIEVEAVTIVPGTLGPYAFTSATTDTNVLTVGYASNVTGATRTWVAPY